MRRSRWMGIDQRQYDQLEEAAISNKIVDQYICNLFVAVLGA